MLPILAIGFFLIVASIFQFFSEVNKLVIKERYIEMATEEDIQPIFIYPIEITDLNQFAINMCNLGLAVINQCIEQYITSGDENNLSSFCQSVVNEIRQGHDLTTDVQYLWAFLPQQNGELRDVFNEYKTSNPQVWTDLPAYIRYEFSKELSEVYQTVFYYLDIRSFHYAKPPDDYNPTPCAYVGIITK